MHVVTGRSCPPSCACMQSLAGHALPPVHACSHWQVMSSLLCSNVIEMRQQWKEAFQRQHGVKLGFMSPFVRAACHALQLQPIVNAGTWTLYPSKPHPLTTTPWRLCTTLCVTDHTHFLSTVIDGADILYRDYVDISVAVATPKVSHAM